MKENLKKISNLIYDNKHNFSDIDYLCIQNILKEINNFEIYKIVYLIIDRDLNISSYHTKYFKLHICDENCSFCNISKRWVNGEIEIDDINQFVADKFLLITLHTFSEKNIVIISDIEKE